MSQNATKSGGLKQKYGSAIVGYVLPGKRAAVSLVVALSLIAYTSLLLEGPS